MQKLLWGPKFRHVSRIKRINFQRRDLQSLLKLVRSKDIEALHHTPLSQKRQASRTEAPVGWAWERGRERPCFIFLKIIVFNVLEEAAGKCWKDWDVREIMSQKKSCSGSREPLLINIHLPASGEGQTHAHTHPPSQLSIRRRGFIQNGSAHKYEVTMQSPRNV